MHNEMYIQHQSTKHFIFKGSGTTYVNEKSLWWAEIHKTLHKCSFQSKRILAVLNAYDHQTLLATDIT